MTEFSGSKVSKRVKLPELANLALGKNEQSLSIPGRFFVKGCVLKLSITGILICNLFDRFLVLKHVKLAKLALGKNEYDVQNV